MPRGGLYRARTLYNWDAVQFALALREFDVAKHQPHPPGFVLYVGLGRLIHAGLGDASLVYVVLAMCFSAGTTFLVYWLARALYGRLTAFASAALLAVSPLFWFYGAIGLTYAAEAFAATLVALHSLRTLRGSVVDLYRGALLLGLAGGMRLSVLVLLFPLWLGSGILGMRSRPPILRALGVLGAAILAWLLPLLWFTGGPGAYLSASTQLYSTGYGLHRYETAPSAIRIR